MRGKRGTTPRRREQSGYWLRIRERADELTQRLDARFAQGPRLLGSSEHAQLADLVGGNDVANRAEAWAMDHWPGRLRLLEHRGQSPESIQRRHLQRIAAAAADLAELLRSDPHSLGRLYGIRGVLNLHAQPGERAYLLTAAPDVLGELDRLGLRARDEAAKTKGKPGKRTAAPEFVHAVESIAYFLKNQGVPFSSAENSKMTRACRLLLEALGYSGDVRPVLRRIARDREKVRRAFLSACGGDIQPGADDDNAP